MPLIDFDFNWPYLTFIGIIWPSLTLFDLNPNKHGIENWFFGTGEGAFKPPPPHEKYLRVKL